VSGDQQLTRTGPAHPRRFRVLVVALSLLAVIMSAAFIAEGVKGVQDEQLRNNSQAQRITASIDRVVESCRDKGIGSGGLRRVCVFDSFGHYTVAGQVESDVRIVVGAAAPVRNQQLILVDPADARQVVLVSDSGFGKIAAGAVGVLMLLILAGMWAARMHRRTIARKRNGSHLPVMHSS
jgi:hypothetical protein